MKVSFKLAISYLAICASTISFADSKSSVIGKAYSLKNGELLYQEIHDVKGSTRRVTYSEPDGTVFANKSINYALSNYQPSFEQTNRRNGEVIKVIQQDKDILITYKANTDAKESSKPLTLKPSMVIDAGFDPFIKAHWSELIGGEAFKIDYVVPSRQTTLSFRFRQNDCLEGSGQNAICFALAPTSWVIKMAVDPIIIAYDRNTKQLLRFSGRANISTKSGKYEPVDIRYRYSKD